MTFEGHFVQPSIPRFDGHYDHWSMLMENFLRNKEYWSLIETGYEEPAHGEQPLSEGRQRELDAVKLKDLKAKNYLFQAIDRSILETILDKDTSKKIWDSMKTKYEGNARVKRSTLQALRRDFEVLEMKVGETITNYFARVMIVANKMRVYGEIMTDVTICEKILRSLTDKFNYIVCSIEESRNLDTITIDELQSSLTVHEKKFHRGNGVEQVLKVTTDDRVWGRGRGRNSFRGRGRGRGGAAFNKAIVECYKSHNLGHFQYECPKWDKEANYAEVNEEYDMLLMSYLESPDTQQIDAWFLDSGCSNHMCGNKGMFTTLNESFIHSVKLGNNSRMNVIGKGSIKLVLNGISHVVHEVYYVPELKNNLLSIRQLQERGLTILIQGGVCKIYHPVKGLIIQTEMSMNRMFILLSHTPVSLTAPSEGCFYTSSPDLFHLWHRRYGHLSYKGLKALQHKGMVHGLPQFQVSDTTSINCIHGKQHRGIMPAKSTWRASQPLELIHADICGPISPISNSGKRYTLCFIDDFSHKSWVYLLTAKSEALLCFQFFKKLVEKEKAFNIKCLRTDRGGEFTSTEFTDFCKANGIKRQLTTAYTPQQNGVAERKNRIVMNMVRSMLSDKQLPKTFWPEAVNWTFYVLNRCPTLAVKNVTPQEA
ncbi:hypothetical protein NC653_033347 [Populus alba x Populus x berolinensis]|uniref:Integrase catalytic domain-containing protein n=1 Tax=Populus alba x Populus x berolinensis TaxID=444605 RepID=A0AAD6PZ04_9ROSI|nr:hypothetical protein NC653_033347 [Populus alba x Populus x berolinensis]